jgi:hypothetical protein
LTHNIDLQITGPDYTLSRLLTVEDCDKAIVILSEMIATIEGQLASRADADPEWMKKATRALSLKRATRQQVYIKRKDFRVQQHDVWNQRFGDIVKQLDPELFYRAVEATNALFDQQLKAA